MGSRDASWARVDGLSPAGHGAHLSVAVGPLAPGVLASGAVHFSDSVLSRSRRHDHVGAAEYAGSVRLRRACGVYLAMAAVEGRWRGRRQRLSRAADLVAVSAGVRVGDDDRDAWCDGGNAGAARIPARSRAPDDDQRAAIRDLAHRPVLHEIQLLLSSGRAARAP